jgi:predicted TIM-barrel fold metal-dependent hydrolase
MKKKGVEMIKALGLSPADERKVYGENAKALLKL